LTARVYPAGTMGSAFAERAGGLALWALVAFIAFLALNLAVGARGIVPDYDGLSYTARALTTYLGATGQLDPAGNAVWNPLHFTNTLDIVLVALLYGVMDYHIAIWVVHTAYVVAFAVLLRRLYDAPTALVIFAWTIANAFLLHQYTDFISEMKVGMFLVLFIAYLFDAQAPRHPWALFAVTVMLLLLRTINLLFVLPLAAVYVALRMLQPARRHEIVAVLKPVVLGIAVLLPVFASVVPRLLDYVHNTTTRSQQNWLDMSGIHTKWELLVAYRRGMWDYDARLQVLALAVAILAAALALTRSRARLRELRDPAIGALLVFAVLMQASSTNVQVVFWLFALEALLAGLLLRALVPPPVVAIIGSALALYAVTVDFGHLLSHNRATREAAPVAQLGRDMAQVIGNRARPVVFQNFAGVGPLDVLGLQVATGRRLGWPTLDAISYDTPVESFLKALRESNVAFIANRNFVFPTYLGVNRHVEQISKAMAEHGAEWGWIHAAKLTYAADSTAYVDAYLRPAAHVRTKYARYNDPWLDLDTPVVLEAPDSRAIPRGYALEVAVMIPQVRQPAFQPPWNAILEDSSGHPVAKAAVNAPGDAVLRFDAGGLQSGTYTLRFDKSFQSPGDPRRLVAQFRSAVLRFAPAAP